MLEPRDLHLDDFLRRFLDRNGPGPHHVTYKVDDFDAVLAAAEAAGYAAVGVDRSNPDWKVGYLHPKQSHGIVVQLAQSASGREPPADFGLTPSKAARPALLERVVLAVADLDAASTLFGGPLAGTELAGGEEPLGRFVDLGWPGGGVLRLLAPSDPAALGVAGNPVGSPPPRPFRRGRARRDQRHPTDRGRRVGGPARTEPGDPAQICPAKLICSPGPGDGGRG